ncbi:helix-turn-helix transcriptional regulator [Actibacterium sp. 188UL27-1]|uniref:helix-turn-helix transcriptional regulator n=1 Tax=Actibacterium sp. 188UL27-1 TaxID=2786961 RepID=UPI0019595224|nr:helix-turn-helix transcriptional regulator [Actibacterium sp. 188UL27-1]MBM7066180.1 helix-turn-helix transcriptional regulator [Actibacterium sp. 188UL27-1]
MTSPYILAAVLIIQVFCAIFFVSDILISILGLPIGPINWQVHEFIEIGAALGLILGVVVGLLAVRQARRRTARVEDQLRAASGAFLELLEERFATWGLTPAERDVALFAIKGMTTQEIANLRSTSEGTVKAQTNAIYRKAGVSGRPQLLSLFIDDLMDDALAPARASQLAVAVK